MIKATIVSGKTTNGGKIEGGGVIFLSVPLERKP